VATSELPTYQAIFQVLQNDDPLILFMPRPDNENASRVFDLNAVPKTVRVDGEDVVMPFPYLELGETTRVPKNVFRARGDDITLIIHGWSSKNGKEELEIVHDLVDDALDWEDLVIPGYKCLNCECEFSQVMRDDSTGIHLMHSVDRYRIWTRKV
jgi:hypothetical protein